MGDDLLGRLLIENQFLTEEQLQEVLEKQKSSPEGKLLTEILLEEGLISQRALDTILSIQRKKLEEDAIKAAEQEVPGPAAEDEETEGASPDAVEAEETEFSEGVVLEMIDVSLMRALHVIKRRPV